MAETMFDGFDHTQYQEEIEQRWGKDAYAASDAWWRSMSADEKKAFQTRHIDIAADYAAVRERGRMPAATTCRRSRPGTWPHIPTATCSGHSLVE